MYCVICKCLSTVASFIYVQQINYSEKTKYILFINLLGSLSNLVISFILIPIFGLIGAAISLLISTIIYCFYMPQELVKS